MKTFPFLFSLKHISFLHTNEMSSWTTVRNVNIPYPLTYKSLCYCFIVSWVTKRDNISSHFHFYCYKIILFLIKMFNMMTQMIPLMFGTERKQWKIQITKTIVYFHSSVHWKPIPTNVKVCYFYIIPRGYIFYSFYMKQRYWACRRFLRPSGGVSYLGMFKIYLHWISISAPPKKLLRRAK